MAPQLTKENQHELTQLVWPYDSFIYKQFWLDIVAAVFHLFGSLSPKTIQRMFPLMQEQHRNVCTC